MKKFRDIGFDSEEASKVVESLNLLLSNYQVFYQKLRNFHWNVSGDQFFELHEVFETMYNVVKVDIDDIAERIKVFGKSPYSTLKEYIETSEIQECPSDFSSDKMTTEIVADIDILLSFFIESYEEAALVGDIGTVDMIKKMVKWAEKQHWMLSSYNS